MTREGEEVHIKVEEQEFRGRVVGSRAVRDFFTFCTLGFSKGEPVTNHSGNSLVAVPYRL